MGCPGGRLGVPGTFALVLFAALAFVAFRVALGAAGMAHLAVHRAALSVLDGVVPSALLALVLVVFLPAGYSLNLVWLSKIAKMARGTDAKKKK